MRHFLIVLFSFTILYAGPIVEIITFDAPYTGTGIYYEDGMEIERMHEFFPLFHPEHSGVLSFHESGGDPISLDGSEVVFRMDDRTFNLLSIDVVEDMDVSTYFAIIGEGGSLSFNGFGPFDPDGGGVGFMGTISLIGYDFLTDISEFTITGGGFSSYLDNIVFRTYEIVEGVPEPSSFILVSLSTLLLLCFMVRKKSLIG